MWSKMLLLNLNIFIIIAIVDSSSNVVFLETQGVKKFNDTVFNQTVQSSQMQYTPQPQQTVQSSQIQHNPQPQQTVQSSQPQQQVKPIQLQQTIKPLQPQQTAQSSQMQYTPQPQQTVQSSQMQYNPQPQQTVQSSQPQQPVKPIQPQQTVKPLHPRPLQLPTDQPPPSQIVQQSPSEQQTTSQSTAQRIQTTTYKPSRVSTYKYFEQSTSAEEKVTTSKYSERLSTPVYNSINKNETLILGLYEAALKIEKSLDKLNVYDPKSDHNIIVSPICIIAALSLVLLGTRGETKTEMSKLFGFDENTLLSTTESSNENYKKLGTLLDYFQSNSGENLGTQVNLAKAIFIQNGYNILPNYKTAAKEYLNSELITLDFMKNGEQSQKFINQWVSNQTHGKINYIMQDIPLPDTKTVIASALYFTGEWEHPFFVNYTRIKPFFFGSNNLHTEGGKKTARHDKEYIFIPMMVGSSEVLYHKNDELEFKAIGLPYKGKKFVTYFVLPEPNVTLRSLVNKIDGNTLRNITKYTNLTEFTYFVPKMTLESFTNLRPVLQNLGINKIFDSSEADFSNMSSEPGSYISDILHKVEIIVNEVGTVASAATVVTITRGGQSTFNVNKPFLFFIHHVESDTVVFWSTVNKPTPYTTTPPNPNLKIKT